MKGVTFEGPFKVEVKDVPEPAVQDPTDVIIKVAAAAVCGSDLHVYNGRLPMPITGWTFGHEYIGVVQETGSAVTNLKAGDRVVGAFTASCGECFYCQRRWPTQCVKIQYFGFGQIGGAQAEYLRVPFGHFTLEKVPDGIPDEKAIFVGDILSTGYFCADQGGIQPGDVVAVVGSGPVGLFTQMCARLFQPAAVVAIDAIPERLALAEKIGSIPVNMKEANPLDAIRRLADGRGADVVLESVGHADSLSSCFTFVRPGGTISAVGMYSEPEFPFPMFQAFLRDLTFKIGVCPVKNYMAQLLSFIKEGKLDPSVIITHTMPLAEAPHAYDIFANRKENCVKVVLTP
ncbi:MAG: alcohol dehydrogenase catalytic domain-containing protein [Chloroflexi bacterium]|nr:alcohol dehydrogenase catalytic domain-containing protein [Chloroflexota bacterium]